MMIVNVIRTSTSLPAPRHHEVARISEHTTDLNPIRFHALAGSMNNQGAVHPLVSIHVEHLDTLNGYLVYFSFKAHLPRS